MEEDSATPLIARFVVTWGSLICHQLVGGGNFSGEYSKRLSPSYPPSKDIPRGCRHSLRRLCVGIGDRCFFVSRTRLPQGAGLGS